MTGLTRGRWPVIGENHAAHEPPATGHRPPLPASATVTDTLEDFMLARRCAFLIPLAIAAFVAGCGGPKSTTTPTSPSATASTPSTVAIDLNVTTPPGTQGAGVDRPVVGTVGSVTGTCPAVTFVVSGVTVHVTANTAYESGSCADLKDGVTAGAIGSKISDGSVEARRVKIGPATPPPHVEGAVTGLIGTCPALTFTLAGTTVHTTDRTRFEGGSCADVKEGARAGAAGPKDSTGAIVAQMVKIAPPPPPHVEGPVAGLTGACPALTFTLSGTTVHTTDKTVFEGGTCADVKEGVRAGAIGPKDASGAITAERVRLGQPQPRVIGVVTSASGACPSLTFVVKPPADAPAPSPVIVHVTDKTRFEGGTCGDIKVDAHVGAMGPTGADGAIEAVGVRIGVK